MAHSGKAGEGVNTNAYTVPCWLGLELDSDVLDCVAPLFGGVVAEAAGGEI